MCQVRVPQTIRQSGKSVVVALCEEARADDSHHGVEHISLGHLTSSNQALGTGESSPCREVFSESVEDRVHMRILFSHQACFLTTPLRFLSQRVCDGSVSDRDLFVNVEQRDVENVAQR